MSLRDRARERFLALTRKADVLARVLRVPAIGPRAAVLGLKIIFQVVVANAVAAFFVTSYLTLTEEAPVDDWPKVVARNAFLYVSLLGALTIVALVRGRIVFAPSWSWLDKEGEPTADERRALLQQPIRLGRFPIRWWVSAIVIAMVGSVVAGDPSTARLVTIGVAIFQGGLIACALCYLAGERALRPAFAEALAGQAPDIESPIGLRLRLVLAWGLGSGIPLLGVVLTPLLAKNLELSSWMPMAFLGIMGLVSGAMLTAAAATSILDPVRRVRGAIQQVAGGNLDVEVVVDDGGQLGRLQAGVNELVGALRERRQLEDLFGRHVGIEVARQAIERGVELGGELRHVSALFVDLRASTELAQKLTPTQVVALLNEFFEAVVRCSDREAGWVDKFEGDAAMCVFGAPADQPDHATRCLRMARALSAELEALRAVHPELDAGIGVASGPAVAGHVGTETRLEYTVIGPAVNTAARLVVAAKVRHARALADAEIIGSADKEEADRWHEAGVVDLKGLPAALAVWEPTEPAGVTPRLSGARAPAPHRQPAR